MRHGEHAEGRARAAEGFSLAWIPHKGRNKPPHQYWTDVPPGGHDYRPVPMPTRWLVESVLDRIAASKVYLGRDFTGSSALDYMAREQASEKLPPDTYAKLRFLLTLYRDRGETFTFRFLRQVVLKEIPFEEWEKKEREPE